MKWVFESAKAGFLAQNDSAAYFTPTGLLSERGREREQVEELNRCPLN